MGCGQKNRWSHPGFERFLPPSCTQAPPITRLQARKVRLGPRCRKIVPPSFCKVEKRLRHLGTDEVSSNILRAGFAVTGPVETARRRR